MSRQTAQAEVNTFVKGLVTEANPLTFPENASLDELNLVISKDGSRSRRVGVDFESGFKILDTGVVYDETSVVSSYTWKNPGGYPEKEFSVSQIGSAILIFDTSVTPVSNSLLYKVDVGSTKSTKMALTSVDGLLVIASGQSEIHSINYDGEFSLSTGRLKVRDLFAVADVQDGEDLRSGSGLAVRPEKLTDAHLYNLRNQTWAIPRYVNNDEVLYDVVDEYFKRYNHYQSNSDSLHPFFYAISADEDDRETQRFDARNMEKNPLGTLTAPLGYFIIDALERGKSRMEELTKLHSTYKQNILKVGNLPVDSTPGGATAIGGYAGRVWYGGFSSQIVDGDANSPRMTSYVLFSRLVDKTPDIFKCYQDGDPTSTTTPDLVDTDGGFIRIDGAYNIQSLVSLGDSLMVVAENGLWRISGGSGYGFKSTNYLVNKITEHGSISQDSVLVVDDTLMYWSDDGIYHAKPNQYGDWVASNLTSTSIKKFFNDIPYTSKVSCKGVYDIYERRVRWLYNCSIGSTGDVKELVLDIDFGAFLPVSVKTLDASLQFPRMLSPIKVPPFRTGTIVSNIISGIGDVAVSANGDRVTTHKSGQVDGVSETYYLTMTGIVNGNIQVTFAYYNDETFTDWRSSDGVGVDANAYLLTGWSGMGDFQRQKQMQFLTVYATKTETGFDANFNPENTSSILTQAQWNWTDSAAAGKWGQKFQAYRHGRLWIPKDNTSGFDDGERVVTTRNKLRGRGRVISLLFETEPKKDFKLLGWSYTINMNGSV